MLYRIDVSMPQWIGLGRADYKEWTIGPSYSEQNPMHWVDNPPAMQVVFDAGPDRYLGIELRQ